PGGLAGDFDRQTAVQTDLVGGTPGVGGGAAHVGEPRRQGLGCDPDEVREPGVAEGARPALRPLALASDPDRDARGLERLGIEGDVFEAVVASLEARPLLAPEHAQQAKLLVGPSAPLAEGDLERLELLDHPARADPQVEAAAGEMVD